MFDLVAALPFALIAAAILANALLYLGRERVTRAHRGRPDPALVAPVRAFLAECIATAAVLATWPLGGGPRRSASVSAGSRLAILLPDGAVSGAAFFLLRRRLRRRGWPSVVGVRRTMPARLDSAVRELDETVRRLGAGGTTLSLIGHGTGGLVGRAYLAGNPAPGVRQLLTLGTPRHGTESPVARLPGFRALAPGSQLMRRLDTRPPRGDGTERVAIYSEFDAWVVPLEAAYDAGAFNIQVRGVGHFALLFSRKVFELVAENLPARDPHSAAR